LNHEIRIDYDFLKKNELIENFLFECQCALFLIDITNPDSFNLVKKLIEIIDLDKYPYLNEILVINKVDLDSCRMISNIEIKEYLQKNKMLDSIEISIKTGVNFQKLNEMINKASAQSQDIIPLNRVFEREWKQNSNDGSISILLTGDCSVGKTNFLLQYKKNQNREIFSCTIGIDKEVKYINIDNKNYKLAVWDQSGHERFRCMPKNIYQNANGILLLFDVTNESSFDNIEIWIKFIKESRTSKHTSNIEDTKLDIPLYLIGNKIDRDKRVITREKAEKMAKLLGMKYFEISVKLNLNIKEIMARMIIEIYNILNPNKISLNQSLNQFKSQKLLKYIDY